MKSLRIIAIIALGSFGLLFAAETAKDVPAKQAGCCAAAAKDGKACTHGDHCVVAAKAGLNCVTCGGSGPAPAPAKK
ncbi:MAG: hypothetical protein ABIZ81_04475 [Opitutaceae bacterium]